VVSYKHLREDLFKEKFYSLLIIWTSTYWLQQEQEASIKWWT